MSQIKLMKTKKTGEITQSAKARKPGAKSGKRIARHRNYVTSSRRNLLFWNLGAKSNLLRHLRGNGERMLDTPSVMCACKACFLSVFLSH